MNLAKQTHCVGLMTERETKKPPPSNKNSRALGSLEVSFLLFDHISVIDTFS